MGQAVGLVAQVPGAVHCLRLQYPFDPHCVFEEQAMASSCSTDWVDSRLPGSLDSALLQATVNARLVTIESAKIARRMDASFPFFEAAIGRLPTVHTSSIARSLSV